MSGIILICATAADGTGQRAWTWDFQTNGLIDSILQNPSWIFTAAANYNTTETATDKDGYTCSTVKVVPVTAGTPVWKEVSPR